MKKAFYTSLAFFIVMISALREADGAELIQPDDLVYQGAFNLPGGSNGSSWEWEGGNALTYYPNGDLGSSDAYSGSLFGTGHTPDNNIHEQSVAEINIPEPVISIDKNLGDLNTASYLQGFADIKSGLFGPLELPTSGLQYLNGKLHFCFGQHFQSLEVSHGLCDLDLSNPNVFGAWHFGVYSNYATNDYMFEIPSDWADKNTPGKYLVTGRFREGEWSGHGPALFAYTPFNMSGGTPPQGGTITNITPLLLYGIQEPGNDLITFSDQMEINNFKYADQWTGGAWLTAGNSSAVVIVGTKAMGDSWYGYYDGTRWPDEGQGQRGYWADSIEAQMLFFNPDDLGSVANGTMSSYEPQPYAVMNLSPYFFDSGYDYERDKRILTGGVAYDRANGFLFVVEKRVEDGNEISVVHVWKVNGGASHSTKVVSESKIIVERSMYWASDGIEWVDGHCGAGVADISTSWYLAEGSTRCFDTWVLLQNPNSVQANVTLTFMIPDGNPIIVNDTINAVSRKTYKVNDYVQNSDVSTKVESDIGIIAERSMYWDSGGIEWVGGHTSSGVTNTSTTWYLAEGCTRGFDTWLLLQNPNSVRANVTLTFMIPDGNPIIVNDIINAVSRKTYKVNDYVQNSDVSTKVESDIGIIAEKSMYWDSAGIKWVGGHCNPGVISPSTTWYLAEGCTRGSFSEWVLIQNPNNQSANVAITFMKSDGSIVTATRVLNPVSRETILVNNYVKGGDVSIIAESDVGIIVERSMYWDSAGIKWIGGHCSSGVTSPSESWYLAEGCTTDSFSEWLLIQNPNSTEADVVVTFMTMDGKATTVNVSVGATSRYTIRVNDYV